MTASSNRRLIVVVDSPLTSRDRARYQLDSLKSAAMSLEVWDVHRVVLPRRDDPQLAIADLSYIQFDSSAGLAAACRELTHFDVVVVVSGMEAGGEARYHDLREALLRSSARVGAVHAASRPPLPQASRRRSLLWRITRIIRLLAARRMSVARMTARLGEVLRGQKTVVGGDRPKLTWAWTGPGPFPMDQVVVGPETIRRSLHTWDFDEELRRPTTRVPRSGIAVVDCMGPIHPDFAVLDFPTFVPPSEWFARTVDLCSSLAEALGERVVIAAHPRAPEGLLDSWYDPYEVSYGATRQLVANARLVVAAQPSTALGLCALYGTPVYLASGPELYEGHREELASYARALGVVLMDSVPSREVLESMLVTPPNAEEFVNRYMTSDRQSEVPFWEVVLEDVQR